MTKKERVILSDYLLEIAAHIRPSMCSWVKGKLVALACSIHEGDDITKRDSHKRKSNAPHYGERLALNTTTSASPCSEITVDPFPFEKD